MKEFFTSIIYGIVSFFDTYGRARAASELARQGKIDEALRLMEMDNEVHP